MKDNKEFLESAKCHGAFYGTSKSTVKEAIEKGENIILEMGPTFLEKNGNYD